jgi:hypothetical protein
MHAKFSHSDNLGHNWLRLFSPYRKFAYFYDKLHVEPRCRKLQPPLPQLNVELVSWYITKSCFGVVHNIELGGGGDKVYFVNVQ